MSSIITDITPIDPSKLNRELLWKAKHNDVSNLLTGLNPYGQNKFESRMKQILSDFGVTDPIGIGKNAEGRFILFQEHPEQEAIQEAINSDATLREILDNPDHSYDISKGGLFATNGYDTAHFTAEAMKLHEEWKNKGTPVEATVEGTAKMLAMQAGYKFKPVFTLEQEKELMETGTVTFSEEAPGVPSSLNSESINKVLEQQEYIETELKSLLKKAGIEPDSIKNVMMFVNSIYDKNSPNSKSDVNAFNISKEDAATIQDILEKPENATLVSMLETYVGEARKITSELEAATGLTDRDIADIMKEGVGLRNINNEKLQGLLSEDPDLAEALQGFLQEGSILSNITGQSSRQKAELAVHGLEHAIMTALQNFKQTLGVKEYNELRQNLTVTASSDGKYSIAGTSNKEVLKVLHDYAAYYTSGTFAEDLKKGEAYHQALNGTDGSTPATYTITFADKEGPTSEVQWGGGYTKDQEAAARAEVNDKVTELINRTLKQEGRRELAAPVEVTVDKDGKITAKFTKPDPNRATVERVIEEMNASIQEDIKTMRNGYPVGDQLSNSVFDLVRHGSSTLSRIEYWPW
ncbi:MAG: hypothetical protein LIQ31_09230 [Planctomycetes bacterium]|nr:hypothetical protein [Planctomycetota bacterium]